MGERRYENRLHTEVEEPWHADAAAIGAEADAEIVALLERVAELEAECFSLAAGQCAVPDGLAGDEGGTPVCRLRRHASLALSRVSAECSDRTHRLVFERTLRHIAGLPNDEFARALLGEGGEG